MRAHFFAALIASAFMSCIACAEHGESIPEAGNRVGHHHHVSPRATQIATIQGDAMAGVVRFEATCKSCHGADGKGGVYDFSLVESAQLHGDDELAHSMITGLRDMPPYGDMFSDEQMADLLAHIHTF